MTDMSYAPPGWSGIQVSKVCLGGMSLGKTSPQFHQWTIDADATEQPSVQHGAHPILPMASGHLTHPSWDSDSKRGTTDGTMRNKVRSGTCAGYADHRTRARARGTARRADGTDRPRLALGQGRHGTDRRLLEDGARG